MKAWTDAGDIVGAKGSVKRTDKGELSVYVKSWAMLTKSVLPLPDKFHGLKDTEKRYRQVYIVIVVVECALVQYRLWVVVPLSRPGLCFCFVCEWSAMEGPLVRYTRLPVFVVSLSCPPPLWQFTVYCKRML